MERSTKIPSEGTGAVWDVTWGPDSPRQGLAKRESFASLPTGTSHVLPVVTVAANITQNVAQVQYHKF